MIPLSYDKELKELEKAVELCDPETSRILAYFMKEANTSSGIPDHIEDDVQRLASKFKRDCTCYTHEEKKELICKR